MRLRADALSERKRQILDGIAAGKSNGVLADELGITVDGVKWHVSELLWDSGCSDRRELADWWRRERGKSAAPVLFALRWPSPAAVGSVGSVAFILALTAVLALGVYAGWTCGSGATRTATVIAPAPSLGKIAYVQQGDIWVKALPDGTPQRLTHDGKSSAPKWSPSGQWLTYASGNAEWIVRADGSDARRVAWLMWAPTGDRFIMVGSDGAISIENDNGSGQRVVVPAPSAPPGMTAQIQGVAWSPDGKWLAYSVLEQATAGAPPARHMTVWRVPVDGGTPEMIYDAGTPTADGVAPAGWIADGSEIVVSIDLSFSASLQADGLPYGLLPAAGGSLRPLTRSGTIFGPYPAPSGNLLLFADGAGRETWTHKRIAVVDPTTGRITDLTDPAVAAIEPAWSPDARKIAYVAAPAASTAGGEPAKAAMAKRKIWVMSSDGSGQRQLTNDPAYRDEAPQWSSDGSQIMFARLDTNEQLSLWIVASSGGQPDEVIHQLPATATEAGPLWWGYYGRPTWGGLYDWWRPPVR